MPAGRKPTPTALKLVTGNPGKRPPLVMHEAEPPLARPSPPEHLGTEAMVEWGRIIDDLYDCGLMTTIDRAALAGYCDAYGQWVEASRVLAEMAAANPRTKGLLIKTTNDNMIQNPVVGTIRCARADMMSYAREFGMTPSARARIDVGIGNANGDRERKANEGDGTEGRARAGKAKADHRYF